MNIHIEKNIGMEKYLDWLHVEISRERQKDDKKKNITKNFHPT
jgi:hypothetical protein